ncbi:MAG: flippase-like domain-containing protein [Ruminococcus sp.]|nr:flippase-like domain-containing protein [Ruminococcus sp.]
MADVPKQKRKFKISGTLIFNLIVAVISVWLVINFIVTEDGLIDLLKRPDNFKWGWVIAGLLVFDMNMIIDSFVTLIYLRAEYPQFRFIDALKTAFVGVFFGAVTPSNTGGQPMQLYFLSQKNIRIGYGSACLTQKFIVYQLVTTAFSVFAVIIRFNFFQSAFTNFWSSAFIVIGFVVQLAVTAMFLIVCFAEGVTKKLIRLIYRIFKAIPLIKNPMKKIRTVSREFKMFHTSNRMLMRNKKRLALIFLLVLLQILCIMSVPYFLYVAFDMPALAAANGLRPGNFFDFLCIQSFVLFTSNLVPLPGASGGAELAFSMYFSAYFVIGGVSKIKPAILLWRFITYYGAMLLTAPFSYYTKGKKKTAEINQNIKQDIAAEADAAHTGSDDV